MYKFIALLATALMLVSGFTGTATAEEHLTSLAKEKMTAQAGELALSSIKYMVLGGDIDRSVGHATLALDIARQAGDAELVARLEQLLYVARTVNMLRTASGLEIAGQSIPELKSLACKMAKDAPKEIQGPMRKLAGEYCTPI